MKVKDIMSPDPACCTPTTKLQAVARLMVQHDCGAIPVVSNETMRKPVGVITDRDIIVRTVADGRNPLGMTAADTMTSSCVTVSPETSLEECCQILEDNQIRRVLVVDQDGMCCGIVAQADIARCAPKGETAEVVKEVSEKPRREHVMRAPLVPTT